MKARIHWNKFKKQWTIHTYKSCQQFDKVLVFSEWETELKPEKKTNPRGCVVIPSHESIIINPGDATLNKYEILDRLVYDKEIVDFNYNSGQGLLCDKQLGCFIIQKKQED